MSEQGCVDIGADGRTICLHWIVILFKKLVMHVRLSTQPDNGFSQLTLTTTRARAAGVSSVLSAMS